MEKVCDAVPNYVMKTVLRDLSAKAGNEFCLYPACRGHSPHNETNVNGKQMVNFALGRDLAVMETKYVTR